MKFPIKLQTKTPAPWIALSLALWSSAAVAADGLQPPAAEALWPHWQARLTLQAPSVSMLAGSRWLDGSGSPRSVQSATLLGDYYFASPGSGGFRASGGLMFGLQGGLAPGLGSSGGLQAPVGSLDLGTAASYLGLGFSSSLWRNSLALTADLGLRSERLGVAGATARALLGSQGADYTLRELRLTPLMQLGLRYTF